MIKKKQRFSIRKYTVGVVSVLVATTFLSQSVAYANELNTATLPLENIESSTINNENQNLESRDVTTRRATASTITPRSSEPVIAKKGEVKLSSDAIKIIEVNGVKTVEISLPDNVIYDSSNFITLKLQNVLNPHSIFNTGNITNSNLQTVATLRSNFSYRRDFYTKEDRVFIETLKNKIKEAKTTKALNISREDLVKAAIIENNTPLITTYTLNLKDTINDDQLNRKINIKLNREVQSENNNGYSQYLEYYLGFRNTPEGKEAQRLFLEEVDSKSTTEKRATLIHNDTVLIDAGVVDFVNMRKERLQTFDEGDKYKEVAPASNQRLSVGSLGINLSGNQSVLLSNVAEISSSTAYSRNAYETVSETMTYTDDND